MFGSLNRCQLIGSLGADPEIRSFQNGGKVCNLRVACSESWKDRNSGERKERTEWISVAIFPDGLVGLCERFLRKGSKVYVEGKLQTRKWQDRDGKDRYTTEVVIQAYGGTILKLDKKDGDGGGGRAGSGSGSGRRDEDGGWGGGSSRNEHVGSTGTGGGGGFADDLDDDIPFITADPSLEWRVS